MAIRVRSADQPYGLGDTGRIEVAHLLEIQILSVDANTIRPDDKQVVFNPDTARVLSEVSLAY